MLNFSLSDQASWDFAQLSGDFNPLHVDAVAARRLQFGGTICHGIHVVLKALDLAVAEQLLDLSMVGAFDAVFTGSVQTGQPVEFTVVQEPALRRVRLVGSCQGRSVCNARISTGHSLPKAVAPAEAEPSQPGTPSCPDFAHVEHGLGTNRSVPLAVNRRLFAHLFPSLAAVLPSLPLAGDLLASTRIIGMECPGLHSIYSEFKLQARVARADALRRDMAYSVRRVDPRFRSVQLAVTGGAFEGTLGAFFRAPPVAQPLLSELASTVRADRFSGQNALVVGGSRGLGELVSKILLAGGAKVTLTYAHGRDDSARIRQEANTSGLALGAVKMDISQPLTTELVELLKSSSFTHLYFFATPHISKQSGHRWNTALFETFCSFYLHGFSAVVEAANSMAKSLHVLYPSTVFLDAPEPGFAEYCAAKAAGETLCDVIALRTGLAVYKPRLPRLQTDQNGSFRGVEGVAPLPLMLDLLCSMQPDSSPGPTKSEKSP